MLSRLSHPGTPINISIIIFLFFFFNFFNLFLRELEHKWRRSRERETQNLKQTPGSELSAQSLMWGSNPQTVRS